MKSFQATAINKSTDRPPSPDLIDYEIRGLGGTTLAFDALLVSSKANKIGSSLQERIVELNKENGRLEQEAKYFRNLVILLNHALPAIQFQSQQLCLILGHHGRFVKDLQSLPRLTRKDIKNTSRSQQPKPSNVFPPSLAASRNHAMRLEHEASSLRFPPALGNECFYHNQPEQGSKTISLDRIVVELTRENGWLRHQATEDRNLVAEVLTPLTAQTKSYCSGLWAIMQEFKSNLECIEGEKEENEEGIIHNNSSLGLQPNPDLSTLGLPHNRSWRHIHKSTHGEASSEIFNYTAKLISYEEKLQNRLNNYTSLANKGQVETLPFIEFYVNKLRSSVDKYNDKIVS
jgi:hypothetical protein